MKPVDTRISSGFERHFQTGIQLVIVGMLGWNFMTVQNMAVTIGRLEEKLVAQANTIVLLSRMTEDQYRTKDAERDFNIRDKAILALDTRLSLIERLVYKTDGKGK